jgi:hypothetical protein
MKQTSPDSAAHSPKAWLVKLGLLAIGLGLGTWILLSVLYPLKLPEDFPGPPDLQSQNAALRKLLNDADA